MSLSLHIAFLINVTIARVLTEGVIIDPAIRGCTGIRYTGTTLCQQCLQAFSRPRPHPPPSRSTPPLFSDVQLNSPPTYRRALLSERLEQAIEKSCPLQMMTVQVGRVFLIFFSIKYFPYIVNPLSPPLPTAFSNTSPLCKAPFSGKGG